MANLEKKMIWEHNLPEVDFLENGVEDILAMSTWERPAAVGFPRVWSRFDGPRPLADGRVPSFWVQDVREEDEERVVSIMTENFLRQEETSVCLRVWEDTRFCEDITALWRMLLKQRLTLAAWTKNPDGTPRMIACNVLGVNFKDDEKKEGNSLVTQQVLRSLNYITEKGNLFEKYGVDKYLGGYGLSVIPEFRGQGVGLELLKARVPLCQAVGLHLTATVFTGVASQKQAARAGFQLLVDQPYTEYMHDGEHIYKNAKSPSFQLSALVITPKT